MIQLYFLHLKKEDQIGNSILKYFAFDFLIVSVDIHYAPI